MMSDHPLDKIFEDILARFPDLTHASVRDYCSVKKMLNQSPFLWYKKRMKTTTLSIERLKKSPLILEPMLAFKERYPSTPLSPMGRGRG
jgi:hypothetical protein